MEDFRESRFTGRSENCAHPDRWHSADTDATEDEVSEFVYGLIRGIQPDVCLETGTHLGHTSFQIGSALKKNGQGVLHTYEPQEAKVAQASALCKGLPIVFHAEKSMSPWSFGEIDFAWFDSLLPLRAAEFDYYYQFMNSRTMVAFHDAGAHHGPWSDVIRNHPNVKVIDLPTPRGCLVGRVTK